MKKGNRGKTSGGVIAAIGLLILSKLKWILALLKFTKFGGTLISLVISLGFWAAFYGWKFAVAIIYLMFVHEMGHLVAARQKGIKTSPAIFIPFIGAAISMKEPPKDAATESYLAYGGPLAGLLSIIPAFILFYFTHAPFWALVIMVGALLNLFNLVPVSPLDGGRIVGVLSPHLWLLGLVVLFGLAYLYHSPIMILIIILGLFSWWGRIREDMTIKTIQAESSIISELIAKVNGYRSDLFYTYYNVEEDEAPPVNEVMRSFVKRDLIRLRTEAEDKLKRTKSWFIPFIEDKAKLEKRRLRMLIGEIQDWTYRLDQVNVPSDLDRLISNAENTINKLKERTERINKYYDAPGKTRVMVFIAYVILAALLGGCYLYGERTLNEFYMYMSY